MYECLSNVLFHSVGSDMLQIQTTIFSLGHPIRRLLQHVISFFWGSLKTALCAIMPMPIQDLRDWITHALQAITVDMLH
jgi:hypothetical protein